LKKNIEVIELDGIGSVLFERSGKAKNISISVRPFKGPRVAVPKGVPFEKAQKVAQAKAGWIRNQLDIMRQVEEEHSALVENFEEIDKADARDKLISRLNELSKKHGISYNKVFVRNQKTRWGSCSNKNNINLNINLVRLPDQLIDYAILHELTHIHIKNHSMRFWYELEKLISAAKRLDKKLNEYKILLLR
jgi:predicted metal-dependent hydrolase